MEPEIGIVSREFFLTFDCCLVTVLFSIISAVTSLNRIIISSGNNDTVCELAAVVRKNRKKENLNSVSEIVY